MVSLFAPPVLSPRSIKQGSHIEVLFRLTATEVKKNGIAVFQKRLDKTCLRSMCFTFDSLSIEGPGHKNKRGHGKI